ncbi:V0D/AC39 family V-type ATPase subunit [Salinispira pacifica]
MIGSLLYADAQANARAGLSELLSEEDWLKVRSAGTLEEIVTHLSATAYGADLSESVTSTDELERRLRRSLSYRTRTPLVFLTGAARDLYATLWRSYELEDLFVLLRGIHNQAPPQTIRASLKPLEGISELDWRALSGAGSIAELVEQLEGSAYGEQYGRVLRQALGEYQRRGSVAMLEVAVNIAHYRSLRDLVHSLFGKNRREAIRIIGFMVDSRLVLWACRYRTFYDLSAEEILAATLDRGFAVQPVHLQRLSTSAPVTDVARDIWGTDLPDLEQLHSLSARDALVALELLLRRRRHELADGSLSGYTFHLGLLLAFLVLLDDEVGDIITVAEAAVEGWDREELDRQLIVPRGGAA